MSSFASLDSSDSAHLEGIILDVADKLEIPPGRVITVATANFGVRISSRTDEILNALEESKFPKDMLEVSRRRLADLRAAKADGTLPKEKRSRQAPGVPASGKTKSKRVSTRDLPEDALTELIRPVGVRTSMSRSVIERILRGDVDECRANDVVRVMTAVRELDRPGISVDFLEELLPDSIITADYIGHVTQQNVAIVNLVLSGQFDRATPEVVERIVAAAKKLRFKPQAVAAVEKILDRNAMSKDPNLALERVAKQAKVPLPKLQELVANPRRQTALKVLERVATAFNDLEIENSEFLVARAVIAQRIAIANRPPTPPRVKKFNDRPLLREIAQEFGLDPRHVGRILSGNATSLDDDTFEALLNRAEQRELRVDAVRLVRRQLRLRKAANAHPRVVEIISQRLGIEPADLVRGYFGSLKQWEVDRLISAVASRDLFRDLSEALAAATEDYFADPGRFASSTRKPRVAKPKVTISADSAQNNLALSIKYIAQKTGLTAARVEQIVDNPQRRLFRESIDKVLEAIEELQPKVAKVVTAGQVLKERSDRMEPSASSSGSSGSKSAKPHQQFRDSDQLRALANRFEIDPRAFGRVFVGFFGKISVTKLDEILDAAEEAEFRTSLLPGLRAKVNQLRVIELQATQAKSIADQLGISLGHLQRGNFRGVALSRFETVLASARETDVNDELLNSIATSFAAFSLQPAPARKQRAVAVSAEERERMIVKLADDAGITLAAMRRIADGEYDNVRKIDVIRVLDRIKTERSRLVTRANLNRGLKVARANEDYVALVVGRSAQVVGLCFQGRFSEVMKETAEEIFKTAKKVGYRTDKIPELVEKLDTYHALRNPESAVALISRAAKLPRAKVEALYNDPQAKCRVVTLEKILVAIDSLGSIGSVESIERWREALSRRIEARSSGTTSPNAADRILLRQLAAEFELAPLHCSRVFAGFFGKLSNETIGKMLDRADEIKFRDDRIAELRKQLNQRRTIEAQAAQAESIATDLGISLSQLQNGKFPGVDDEKLDRAISFARLAGAEETLITTIADAFGEFKVQPKATSRRKSTPIDSTERARLIRDLSDEAKVAMPAVVRMADGQYEDVRKIDVVRVIELVEKSRSRIFSLADLRRGIKVARANDEYVAHASGFSVQVVHNCFSGHFDTVKKETAELIFRNSKKYGYRTNDLPGIVKRFETYHALQDPEMVIRLVARQAKVSRAKVAALLEDPSTSAFRSTLEKIVVAIDEFGMTTPAIREWRESLSNRLERMGPSASVARSPEYRAKLRQLAEEVELDPRHCARVFSGFYGQLSDDIIEGLLNRAQEIDFRSEELPDLRVALSLRTFPTRVEPVAVQIANDTGVDPHHVIQVASQNFTSGPAVTSNVIQALRIAGVEPATVELLDSLAQTFFEKRSARTRPARVTAASIAGELEISAAQVRALLDGRRSRLPLEVRLKVTEKCIEGKFRVDDATRAQGDIVKAIENLKTDRVIRLLAEHSSSSAKRVGRLLDPNAKVSPKTMRKLVDAAKVIDDMPDEIFERLRIFRDRLKFIETKTRKRNVKREVAQKIDEICQTLAASGSDEVLARKIFTLRGKHDPAVVATVLKAVRDSGLAPDLCDDVEKMWRQKSIDDARQMSMADVAREARVTRAEIKAVLEGRFDRAPVEVAERVFAAARALNFQIENARELAHDWSKNGRRANQFVAREKHHQVTHFHLTHEDVALIDSYPQLPLRSVAIRTQVRPAHVLAVLQNDMSAVSWKEAVDVYDALRPAAISAAEIDYAIVRWTQHCAPGDDELSAVIARRTGIWADEVYGVLTRRSEVDPRTVSSVLGQAVNLGIPKAWLTEQSTYWHEFFRERRNQLELDFGSGPSRELALDLRPTSVDDLISSDSL